MFKSFCQADLSTVSLSDKRALLNELKAAIKNDVLLNKANRLSLVKAKELAKKQKIEAQIKAAADKLAKLQAKLV